MSNDSLHERGQALEDSFFRDRDQKLIQKIKTEMKAEHDRSALAATTGISDTSVIDQLIEQNITPESLASMALIPLVAVAWADGRMEDDERDAILKATEQSGISPDQASYELVSSWLVHRPQDELLDSWKEYVRALKENLDAAAVKELKKSVIKRATDVADAAGGFMGFGNRISKVEQQVIDELAAAFD